MATPNPIDIHIGKRMRMGRSMLGMSQESVGDALGVTFQQIQKYERGVNCVRVNKLFELAKVLRVSITFFFEDYQEDNGQYSIPGASDNNASYDSDYASSKEIVELMQAFRVIQSDKKRRMIISMAHAMAEDSPILK